MTLVEIFSILIIHFVADFIVQTDEQAKGKSSSWIELTQHTFTYSLVWFIVGLFYWAYILISFKTIATDLAVKTVFIFPLITFLVHTVTDYITSREVKKLFDKEEYHNGFIVVGFDQLLHYAQLFLCYYYLIKI